MFENLKTLKSSMSIPQEDENVDRAINEVFYTAVANIDAIDDLNYAPIAGTVTIN